MTMTPLIRSVLFGLAALPTWWAVCLAAGWWAEYRNPRNGIMTAYAFLLLLGSPVALIVGAVVGWRWR